MKLRRDRDEATDDDGRRVGPDSEGRELTLTMLIWAALVLIVAVAAGVCLYYSAVTLVDLVADRAPE